MSQPMNETNRILALAVLIRAEGFEAHKDAFNKLTVQEMVRLENVLVAVNKAVRAA